MRMLNLASVSHVLGLFEVVVLNTPLSLLYLSSLHGIVFGLFVACLRGNETKIAVNFESTIALQQ